MTDFIIVGNGDFLAKEIISEAIQHKCIIALDGAADRLAALGMLPHVVLGDFDSIQHAKERWGITDAKAPYQGKHGILIVPAKNQDLTDFDKALAYCDQHQANTITVICAYGGLADHHEAVQKAIRLAYRVDRPIVLHTEQQTLRYAQNETLTLRGQPNDRAGVVTHGKGTFSSEGLAYEATQLPDSFCNALTSTEATLVIKGEALVIMPPQLTMQRNLMKLSEEERLKRRLRDLTGEHPLPGSYK
ncbi:MAG: thiamine diphosphokinase [Gammaproteobacteria bacterium RIFCSPHIGHO2_12_FULL_45_12]|nr:MAG: thiamine diphosphokinase [Gammaproteobacteria bacterium RIFCSPHIGHO2_12_FULL_45_12]